MFKVVQRYLYSNLRSYSNLEELNAFLLKNKFAHSLVYFRSNWNPQCEIADQQVTKLAAENRHLEVFKIDSDTAPKIARHYGVRA